MSSSEKLRLGVNIDHVATVRNARGGNTPDPLRAAVLRRCGPTNPAALWPRLEVISCWADGNAAGAAAALAARFPYVDLQPKGLLADGK